MGAFSVLSMMDVARPVLHWCHSAILFRARIITSFIMNSNIQYKLCNYYTQYPNSSPPASQNHEIVNNFLEASTTFTRAVIFYKWCEEKQRSILVFSSPTTSTTTTSSSHGTSNWFTWPPPPPGPLPRAPLTLELCHHLQLDRNWWPLLPQTRSWNSPGRFLKYFNLSKLSDGKFWWNCLLLLSPSMKLQEDCWLTERLRDLNSKLKSLCQLKGEGEMSRMELTGTDSSTNDDNKLPELPWTHLYFYFPVQSCSPVEY